LIIFFHVHLDMPIYLLADTNLSNVSSFTFHL
jgi:hypothetical protein